MQQTDDNSSTTAFGAFASAAECWSDHPFLYIPAGAARTYSDSAVEMQYGEALQQILALRAWYEGAGYGLGHRVALLLENRPAAFLHWFALNGLGVSVVPINGEMSCEEMAYQLLHSESCLAVSVAEKKSAMLDAANSTGLNLPVVVHDELSELPTLPDPPQAVRQTGKVSARCSTHQEAQVNPRAASSTTIIFSMRVAGIETWAVCAPWSAASSGSSRHCPWCT